MRVLYITGMYPNPTYPQKGIFCHEQVKALKKLGVEVDVVVPITVYEKEVKQKIWTYEGVGIRYVRFFKLPGTGDFHRTGKNLFFSLDRAVDLRKYDLYHADAPLPAGQAAMIASQKYGKPFIVHGHGLDVFLEESYKERKNCRKIIDVSVEVYEKADAVCGVSQKVLDKIEKRVKLGNKSYVIYNGVDLEKFYPDDKKEGNYIFAAGNLIPIKGHDDTITAFSLYKKENKDDLRLKIAGHGDKEEELKALAKSLGIIEYVDFLGYVAYEEIRNLMQGAKLFCLPSWYEALGCVYLEAMACGVPVIGCRGNGIDEIIKDGVNGLLVDPHSPEQIYKVINQVMMNGTRQLGEKAREEVSQRYTWNQSARHLASVYGAII